MEFVICCPCHSYRYVFEFLGSFKIITGTGTVLKLFLSSSHHLGYIQSGGSCSQNALQVNFLLFFWEWDLTRSLDRVDENPGKSRDTVLLITEDSHFQVVAVEGWKGNRGKVDQNSLQPPGVWRHQKPFCLDCPFNRFLINHQEYDAIRSLSA